MEIKSKKMFDEIIGVGRLPMIMNGNRIPFYTQDVQGALSLYEFDLKNYDIFKVFTVEHELPHTPVRVYPPAAHTAQGTGIIINNAGGLKICFDAKKELPLLTGCRSFSYNVKENQIAGICSDNIVRGVHLAQLQWSELTSINRPIEKFVPLKSGHLLIDKPENMKYHFTYVAEGVKEEGETRIIPQQPLHVRANESAFILYTDKQIEYIGMPSNWVRSPQPLTPHSRIIAAYIFGSLIGIVTFQIHDDKPSWYMQFTLYNNDGAVVAETEFPDGVMPSHGGANALDLGSTLIIPVCSDGKNELFVIEKITGALSERVSIPGNSIVDIKQYDEDNLVVLSTFSCETAYITVVR